MSTLTIDLPEELAVWLQDKAATTGLTQNEIVREQIEKAKLQSAEKPWMKYAGCISGPSDLSTREGFGER